MDLVLAQATDEDFETTIILSPHGKDELTRWDTHTTKWNGKYNHVFWAWLNDRIRCAKPEMGSIMSRGEHRQSLVNRSDNMAYKSLELADDASTENHCKEQ